MGIVILTSLLLLGPPDGAVDEGFVKWIREAAAPRYGEVAERFVAAAGRDEQVYRDGIARLHEALVAFVEREGRLTEPAARCALLARFLFEEQGFRVDLDLTERENLYPDAILERRRGYCLGLTLVLLDLGERLSWPLVAVSAPRHTFVRYRAATHVNIETTLGGQRRDDEWYQRRYGLSTRAQLVELGPARTAAHLLNNHGYVLLAEQHAGTPALSPNQ